MSNPTEQTIANVLASPPVTITKLKIAQDILSLALSFNGTRERGTNKGKEVEMFQMFVDGKASSEAWCMAFVQWVVGQICAKYGIRTPLHLSERCWTVYQNTSSKYLLSTPSIGSIFIMKQWLNTKGHTGFCTSIAKALSFGTIEGNTNAAGSSEGDGVYIKSRMTTGSVKFKMAGYIDVVSMIYDALVKAGKTNTVLPDAPPVVFSEKQDFNVKGDWTANCDNIVMSTISPELLNLPYSKMKKFMPGWNQMNLAQRRAFYADLLFAMAGPESSYNTLSLYHEDTMKDDRLTGLPTISEGLLQLSYQDLKSYPGLPFDYQADAMALRDDWKRKPAGKLGWKSVHPERTILKPENNVKAAAMILNHILTSASRKNKEFADCVGDYWSCMNRYKGTGFAKKYRPSFLEICAVLKKKGYKT